MFVPLLFFQDLHATVVKKNTYMWALPLLLILL